MMEDADGGWAVSGGVVAAGIRVVRLRSRPVLVPLSPPLGSAAGRIDAAPLLLLDLLDSTGVTGTGYLFCYHPAVLAAAHALAERLAELVVGAPAVPRGLHAALPRRLRLLGRDGIAAMVLGGLDMAAWDGAARRAGLPLVELLGAVAVALPAYASLRSAEPAAVAAEAAAAAEAGFPAVKVKIGHADLAADLAAIRAVRDAAGPGVQIMVDYNQSLTVADALGRLPVLDEEGLAWVEEPVDADDPAGHARLSRRVRTPIQLGENWHGTRTSQGRRSARGHRSRPRP
jgi:mandelate racemase